MRRMKYFIYFFLLIIVSHSIFAQRTNLLYKLTSDSLLKDFQKDSLYRELQENAWELSFIGEYKTAIQKMDLFFDPQKHSVIFKYNNELYKPYSASSYILNRAKKERIIIINESHIQPMHRVFTTSLLKGLYDEGYRYLALEALEAYGQDSILNIRKYPVIESGYYTKEPQYGNMIREALKIGYKIVAYEYGGNDWSHREEEQATNIKKILDKDSTAKILIHCGFGHGSEDASFSQKLMGGLVKDYCKIDPFTINQESWTEHSSHDYEDSYFISLKAKYPAVFIDKKQNLLKGKDYSGYDIDIYHPRTQFINGRPDWLTLNGSRKYYFLPKDKLLKINYPMLVLAYCSNEDSSIAIPVDIMELKSVNDNKALVLPVGAYKIILRSSKGEEYVFNIVIKNTK